MSFGSGYKAKTLFSQVPQQKAGVNKEVGLGLHRQLGDLLDGVNKAIALNPDANKESAAATLIQCHLVVGNCLDANAKVAVGKAPVDESHEDTASYGSSFGFGSRS